MPDRNSALLLDTGGWLRALAGDEGYAPALSGAAPAIVPSPILPEMDWHLRKRRGAMRRILREIGQGRYVFEPVTLADATRASEIDHKFTGLALGYVDAVVAAMAERLGVARILTCDRDFIAVRIGPRYQQALELAVPLR